MGIEDLKRWHWVVIGLILGAICGYVYALPAPDRDPSMRDMMEVSQFVAMVESHGVRGKPVIRNLVIAPPTDGGSLVTGEYLDYRDYKPFFFYARVPFNPKSSISFPTVLEYVRARAGNGSVEFNYLWWRASWFGPMAGAIAGGLLIGGLWPLLLNVMLGAGLGRKKPDDPAYDLDRFKPETAPAKTPATVVTSADAQHLAELEHELEANLTSGATASGAAAQAAQTAAVRKLDGGPLEAMAPGGPEEDKEYKGEFYPVAKPHVHKTDSKKSAFTLIELLVVIGIISILISLIFPALRRARQQADVLKCANNLRQIYMGLQMYLNENHGTCFWRGDNLDIDGMDWCVFGGRESGNANDDPGQAGLFNRVIPRPLNKYVSNKMEIFQCPCDVAPWSYTEPAPTEFEWVGTSYNFNCNGFPKRPLPRHDGGLDGVKFSVIRDSSNTIVFYEACCYWGYEWHFQRKNNICFADGSVRFVPFPPEGTEIQWDAPGTRETTP